MVPEPRYCIVLCVVIVLPCVERAKSGAMFHLTRPECILVKSPPSQCSHQPTNQPTNQPTTLKVPVQCPMSSARLSLRPACRWWSFQPLCGLLQSRRGIRAWCHLKIPASSTCCISRYGHSYRPETGEVLLSQDFSIDAKTCRSCLFVHSLCLKTVMFHIIFAF